MTMALAESPHLTPRPLPPHAGGEGAAAGWVSDEVSR